MAERGARSPGQSPLALSSTSGMFDEFQKYFLKKGLTSRKLW